MEAAWRPRLVEWDRSCACNCCVAFDFKMTLVTYV